MLPDTVAIPFNDLPTLARQLATKQFAAFFVEPIQSEAGIRLPDAGYLKEDQALCSRYGALLVLDEVQTGMYRTAPAVFSPHITTTSSPISSSSPKPSAADSFRAAPCSCRTASMKPHTIH